MIVVDTSALLAVIQDEPVGAKIQAFLRSNGPFAISAATLTEALIVSSRRNLRRSVEDLVAGFGFEIVPVGPDDAHAAADAHDRWGRGMHPAGLNFGDCFAYALAKARGWPLLFVGDDFARTELAPALPA